jgi:hypothetical protein
MTEAGKSQFLSEAAFKDAFAKLRKLKKPHPVDCAVKPNNVHDCAAAADVGITTAIVCNKVDAKGKDKLAKCTDQEDMKPKGVGFWYLNQPGKPDKTGDGGTNGKWILRSAYPSINANCM